MNKFTVRAIITAALSAGAILPATAVSGAATMGGPAAPAAATSRAPQPEMWNYDGYFNNGNACTSFGRTQHHVRWECVSRPGGRWQYRWWS